jgi:hypothetical protein
VVFGLLGLGLATTMILITVRHYGRKIADLVRKESQRAPETMPSLGTLPATVFQPRPALTGVPARVRPLPYPFSTFLSVCSDPDEETWRSYLRLQDLIHSVYQLPLGEQVFIAPSRRQPCPVRFDLDRPDRLPADMLTFHQFLVWYNRGWIDSIHGWSDGPLATASPDFKIVGKGNQVTHTVEFGKPDRPDRARLAKDHHYLIFDYQTSAPDVQWGVQVGKTAVQVVNTAEHVPAQGLMPGPGFIPAFVRWPAGKEGEVTFQTSGAPGSWLEVRNLALTNCCRARMAAEAERLSHYNVGFLTYTEHGKNNNGEFGIGSLETTGPRPRRPFIGDDPVQAFNGYFFDILDRTGVLFVAPYCRTAPQYNPGPVTDVVTPYPAQDGQARYSLNRLYFHQYNADGSPYQTRIDSSWEPWLGWHLRNLRTQSVRPGEGGVLYTHWGAKNSEDEGFSPATRKELQALCECYYDYKGRVAPHERVWVAPASEIALYARSLRGLRGNAVYDEARNCVLLGSWIDPASRQPIPASGSRAFGLGNLTFYVRDARTARVIIDNVEYTALQRNPRDESGQESVTLIDDSVPTTLFDEIDLYHQNGVCTTDQAECYFRSSGAAVGRYCLEVKLTGSQGHARWALPGRSTIGHTHLRFSYRKSNPAARVALRLQLADKRELVASEKSEPTPGWELPFREDAEWHDVVVSFADLRDRGKLDGPPLGALEALRFEMAGEAQDQVFFDRVQLLRQPCQPLPSGGLCLVGGQVDPPRDGVTVVLEDGGSAHKTTTRQGVFFFDQKVPAGSIVRVYAIPEDGARRYPRTGRSQHILKNEVELSISLADRRDPPRDVPLKRVNKVISDIHPEGGTRLKPKSIHINSGMPTAARQEWLTEIQASNLGFLDKDRRFENLDRARRVLLIGHCVPYGHSTPRSGHLNLILEEELRRRVGYPFEVPLLATPSMLFGKCWPYWRAFGRKFDPEVVVMFIQGGVEILEVEPTLMARFNEYDVNHLPCHMFRAGEGDRLEQVEPDPEFFRHVGKDPELRARREAERKKGTYWMDGFDWFWVLHRARPETLPEPAARAMEHFRRVARFYRDQFRRHGARMMLVLTPEVALLNNRGQEWTEDGQVYRRDMPARRFQKVCQELGIGFLDAGAYIESHYPNPTMCGWRYDTHPSPYGLEWLAEGICDYLLQTRFVRDLPGQKPLEIDDVNRLLLSEESR